MYNDPNQSIAWVVYSHEDKLKEEVKLWNAIWWLRMVFW